MLILRHLARYPRWYALSRYTRGYAETRERALASSHRTEQAASEARVAVTAVLQQSQYQSSSPVRLADGYPAALARLCDWSFWQRQPCDACRNALGARARIGLAFPPLIQSSAHALVVQCLHRDSARSADQRAGRHAGFPSRR
jgi:hypothetical protein